jgi:hypothetical protein
MGDVKDVSFYRQQALGIAVEFTLVLIALTL